MKDLKECLFLTFLIFFFGFLFTPISRAFAACSGTTCYVSRDGSGDYNCDGTADQVEINQALGYATSNPGTTIYLKAGTYTIVRPVLIGSYTTLAGDSAAQIKLADNAGWGAEVSLIGPRTTGAHDITVSGFGIDGNIENQSLSENERYGQGWYPLMTFPELNYNITIQNMYLHNSGSDGLRVKYHDSIWDDENVGNIVFINNTVYKIGHDALYTIGLSNVQAYNNDVFTRTNSAFRMQNANHVAIHNNIVHSEHSGNSTGPGIEIQRTDSQQNMNDIDISYNIFHTLNGAAIWMHGLDSDGKCRGKDVHIHHNIMYDVGQYWWYTGYSNGAIVMGYYDTTIIENNVISNWGHGAIMNQLSGPYGNFFGDGQEYENTYSSSVTTVVRNNIFVDGNDSAYDGVGILNTGQANVHYNVYNNCFYNNRINTSGSGITSSNNIISDPLFADAASYDYHLKSQYGRWDGASWVTDGITSPCIDAGYALSAYVSEPSSNGSRINIGRYGNTIEASKSYPVLSAVATPTFSPATGTYTSAQIVTISSSISGATIYYTTNGTTPTTSSSTYSSPLTISATTTVKALAVKAGYTNSAIGTATYTINFPVASTPTFSIAAGTYISSQTVTITSTTTGSIIYYTTDGTNPTTASTQYSAPINVSSSKTIKAIAVKSGYTNSAIGSSSYTITGTVSTPTFSPATGIYTSAQTVTMTSATIGATIYYTTNGTIPTTSSSTYSSPITVSTTTTIKAIAVKSGYTDSDLTSASYTINSPTTPGNGSGDDTSVTPIITKVEITKTEGNILTLSLNVQNATSMMLSESSIFLGSVWETYSPTKTYIKGLIQTKLYLKFKSSTDTISSTLELSIPNTTTITDTPANLYPTGTLLKLPDSPKVYVIIDNKKKWIPTPEVFEQLGYKWTEIKILTLTELNNIPDFEDNLIRALNDYKVYLVVNGVKRHIPNPIIFLDYGFKWNEVKDVPKETIDKYKNTYLIKQSGSNGIYYVSPQEIRKLIPSTEIFNSYNDKQEDIQIISKTEMDFYPLSNLIKLNSSNDIYLIEGNTKKRIPNPQVFNKYKLNWNLVMSVNQTEFNFYSDGGEVK